MTQNRFLLDQMLDVEVSSALSASGHDVVRVSEIGMARADDHDILAKAIALERILVTLDEHFGDWAILPLRKHNGVIRIKVDPATTENILAVLTPFLSHLGNRSFENTLAIVSESRARWINTSEL